MLRSVPWVLFAAGCLPALPDITGLPCDDAHPCGGDYRCVAGLCTRDGSGLGGGGGGVGGGVGGGGGGGGGLGGGGGGQRDGGLGDWCDADLPCGAGLKCVAVGDGGCSLEPGDEPATLFENGSFEAGLANQWQPNGNALADAQGQISRSGLAARVLVANNLDNGIFVLVARGAGFLGTMRPGLYCARGWSQQSVDVSMRLLLRLSDGGSTFHERSSIVVPFDGGWQLYSVGITATEQDRSMTARFSANSKPDASYWVDDFAFWNAAHGLCAPE